MEFILKHIKVIRCYKAPYFFLSKNLTNEKYYAIMKPELRRKYMKTISIDASTKSTGIAYFEDTKLIAYDCFTASSNDLIKRIQKITGGINEFLNKYPADKIILEEVRPENGLQNIQTHRALMWLQAAIAFVLHENHPKTKIEYVYPSQWRAACGIKNGRGIRRDSQKAGDIKFVKETYGIDVNDDIADAIGIGHAYVNELDNEMNWE